MSRIRSLAIPPAWTDVWICPLANGHLQATGRDARGRKQYRYHPDWKELRSGYKYHRLPEFGKVLVRIRRAVQRDLKAQELSRRKVLAAVVRVLEDTMIRVGCEEYARENDSYGLATMRCRHVDFARGRARLKFRGKSAQEQDLEISDPSVVKVIRKCHELSGHELFKYSEGGELRDVGSGDINDYIREVARAEFTAKDFRTWGGTVWAAVELAKLGYGRNVTQQKKRIVEAVKRVAARLGNRPATCRKYYIHPAVFDAFQQGTLHKHFSMGQSNGHYTATAPGKRKSSLTTDEKALLRLLREQEKRSKAKKRRRT